MNFDKNTAANKVLPQWGVKCFYETFVLKQTVVHLLNFGAENPPLRQYPNRCAQVYGMHRFLNLKKMKSLIFIFLTIPLVSSAQQINSTESKNSSNIYNDAIRQYLLFNKSKSSDSIFIQKIENFDKKILPKINGTIVQLLDESGIEARLKRIESFTLHRFFSLKFENGLFNVSVIPFHLTKSSDGISFGNGGGCEIFYSFDNITKRFIFKNVKCLGI